MTDAPRHTLFMEENADTLISELNKPKEINVNYNQFFETKDIAYIAKICHQANKAYCETIDDYSQLDWKDAPSWQKESVLKGVDLHLSGAHGPEATHESWMKEKLDTGWKFGPVKDPEKKEHPCLVPFAELPIEQRIKDFLFRGIVHAFKELIDEKLK